MSFYENPFQRLHSKKIYENPWIEVIEDKVIKPSGKDGIYGRVLFKHYALGVIPIDEDLNTWLVGQYRYALEEYSWEIPEGGGSLEVPPLESAKRELREETGLIAQKWDLITRLHTSNSITNELSFIYVAQDLEQGEPQFDDTEVLQLRKLPLQQAIQMVLEGEITDAISVAGLLFVKNLDIRELTGNS